MSMNRTEEELSVGFRRSRMTEIKGARTRHLITLNPSSARPGEDLYIDIPKLKESTCLVPGSLHLVHDMVVTGTKSYFLNNISKLLQKRLQVRLAGETVYDCSGESLYSVYKDLWLTKSKRLGSIEYGLANENLRKLISGDNSSASSGDSQKVSYALMYSTYGNKQRINLDYINQNHGLYSPFQMNNNFRYVIALPSASGILLAQIGETLGNYSLENLQLEYETIDNLDLANEVSSTYAVGRSLSYEHITLMKTVVWPADSTLINENINVPRKSMRAIVILFTKPVRTDSEEFVYPNLQKVSVTVEGIPNTVYSQGVPKSRFYDEAKRLLSNGDDKDQYMSVERFFEDKFSLVIDLRAHEEQSKTGHGKKIINTQNGILLEISKGTHTGNLNCHIFVVSDALCNFVNNDLQSIQY